ncbi:hypothetical protein EWM64_g1673 [Hericium alpestre]|uniref:RNase III domain-containing protein n=1 Tax=Hericium alpestre TaxID=135208 RepID=A0A4Z0A774_9AGAM|nr:hypothetical protein EWM64_g1673 [Hericium alpestre]
MPNLRKHSFGTILNSTIIAISAHDFDPCLPAIHARTWSNILWSQPGACRDGNERLEFIGDALMYLCLALELYEHFPAAPPGFMTEIRSPLATNLVFSLLAEKIDRRAAKKGSVLQPVAQLKRHAATMIGKQVRAQIPKNIVKAAADTMEMAIGALYIEKGFSAVREWVSTTYEPIIDVAVKAYDRCHDTDFYSVTNEKKRKRQISGNSDHAQQTKKQKLTPKSIRTRPFQENIYPAFVPESHASSSRHAGPSYTAQPDQPETEPMQPEIERIFIDLTNEDSDAGEEEDNSSGNNEEIDGPIFIDLTLSDDDDDDEDLYHAPRIRASSDMQIECSDDENNEVPVPRNLRPNDVDIGSSSEDHELDEVDDLCDASADEVEQSTAQAQIIKSRQDALRCASVSVLWSSETEC